MNTVKVEELYRQYLLDFLKNDFDKIIEGEILSFEEYQKMLEERH